MEKKENENRKYTPENLREDFQAMEDNLNALLADLQTNLSKSQQHKPAHHTATVTFSRTEPHRTSPPPSQHTVDQQHIYQNEDHRVTDQINSQNLQNGINFHQETKSALSTSAKEAPKSSSNPTNIYQNGPSYLPSMYRHEMREEIRTESHSSGPDPATVPRATSNNLSELDSLLQDLNTGKPSTFNNTEKTTVSGSRPSVDSLLDELSSVGHTQSLEKRTMRQDAHYTQTPASYSATRHVATTASASNATKELDDLMESLSDFKGASSREQKDIRRTDYSHQKNIGDDTVVSTSVIRLEEGPPRPPEPAEEDILAVPPPRPPAPPQYVLLNSEDVSLPATLPRPPSPGPPLPTQSIIYRTLNQEGAQHQHHHHLRTDVVVDDPIRRPSSGGPVKRNDAEYRWVTDQIKHEVREIIEEPVVEEKINASSLDTAYAKPLPKRKSPSPPPAPKPSPPNQLDSMLGSLTTHMTEQGVTTTQKGCCCACDKPIVGQVITALGKTWHPEHFTCTHCQQELGTKNFFERDGKPYCEPDYHNLFSPKCSYCSGPILDKCVTALNKTWHPEHFFCAQCGNTFGDEGFHEKNGKPYCKEDYFNMFAPKCGGCNNPIMENYISALNCQWHPDCFVCRDCHQPFNGGSFFDHEGLPYCETHYHAKRGSLCAGCNKPITGRCITAMFRKYHPEHFVCAFCLQQLNKGTFKEQNDKPYCHECFDKLYG